MQRFALVAATGILTLSLVACASSGSTHTGGSQQASGSGRWTGTIRATPTRTGEVAPTKPAAAYQGNVSMSRWEDDTSRTSISIFLSTPESNRSISWALVSGRCGAIEAPVLPVNSFEPLQVGSDGRAETTTHIAFETPTDGSYHVDFYSGNSARLTDVVACADLKQKNR